MEQEIQEREMRAFGEFQTKFNASASKYKYFEDVVTKAAFTPEMVIASRGMADPAAFIYAAAKTQGKEIERISQIQDRMVQAVELGKLEERMRRTRQATNAPRPLDTPRGDVTEKATKPRNIDDLIRLEDARRLKGRR
jgi:hypothetical protein